MKGDKTLCQEDATCKKTEGDAWAKAGEYEKAIACYNKACFVNPNDYTLFFVRGNAYAQLCDFKSAISNYNKVLSMQSNPPQAVKEEIAEIFNALVCLLYMHRIVASDVTPDFRYILLQGHSFLIDGDYTTAIAYLTDAVTLDQLQANYWLHRYNPRKFYDHLFVSIRDRMAIFVID
jgi:tetratricopeptide (TPR) repeat protein